ncbi:hypothetical protein CEXT_298651 [Caerostris extrusa]|uniref:Uncharacterized protein n=1 Tax=Caerostris extrusa TaxID=172846 RepID=A0AAV4N901_CAEEX|nr:hypothetical protein CEXT_298651 [Caerostris extrusa]
MHLKNSTVKRILKDGENLIKTLPKTLDHSKNQHLLLRKVSAKTTFSARGANSRATYIRLFHRFIKLFLIIFCVIFPTLLIGHQQRRRVDRPNPTPRPPPSERGEMLRRPGYDPILAWV